MLTCSSLLGCLPMCFRISVRYVLSFLIHHFIGRMSKRFGRIVLNSCVVVFTRFNTDAQLGMGGNFVMHGDGEIIDPRQEVLIYNDKINATVCGNSGAYAGRVYGVPPHQWALAPRSGHANSRMKALTTGS